MGRWTGCFTTSSFLDNFFGFYFKQQTFSTISIHSQFWHCSTMPNYFKPNQKPCLIVFYRSMTPEEGTGYCIRTTGSMTWKAIWETFRAGAHIVGVGDLLARGMLLILLNITPRYCWNPRLVGRLSPFKPTPKCHFPVQHTRLHPCQWKDKKKDYIK